MSNNKFFMYDWNEEIWDNYIEHLEEQEKLQRQREKEEWESQAEERQREKEEIKNEKEELKEKEKLLKDRENSFIINMINNNIDIETTSKITNLSIEEIIEIQKSL